MLDGDRIERAARWLAGDGGWRLSLSGDPRDALPALASVLDR